MDGTTSAFSGSPSDSHSNDDEHIAVSNISSRAAELTWLIDENSCDCQLLVLSVIAPKDTATLCTMTPCNTLPAS